MSRLCPGKEAEMVSDDFIAVSDVTETVVCDTWLNSMTGGQLRHCLALLWQFFRFHRYRLRFAFPIRNSYPTDIPRKVPLNCQSSARQSTPPPQRELAPQPLRSFLTKNPEVLINGNCPGTLTH